MFSLLIILLATVGLGARAMYGRRLSPAASEPANEIGFTDTCARTLILVLLSLVGLLALGVMYGNVLGSAAAHQ
jgi:hypothetical protein